MKINWGTGVVLAFVCFISFIMYFVVRMSVQDRARHDLVTEDYYKKELGLQQDLDAAARAIRMNAGLRLEWTGEGLMVHFPKGYEPGKIKGTVSLYRPSDRQLDRDFPLKLTDPYLLIPDQSLVKGRWDLTIRWQYGDDSFMHQQKLTY
jgi:hypothetical protein